MGLGGRVAEELVIGDISSARPATSKQITKIARHMVCDWGMSPLGPIAFGDNQDTVFLGREITRTENVSEETARRIDEEDPSHHFRTARAVRKLVAEHRFRPGQIAEALLEYETLEGKHVLEILEFGEMRTPVTVTALGKPGR